MFQQGIQSAFIHPRVWGLIGRQLKESQDVISSLIIKRLNTCSNVYHSFCVNLQNPRTLVYQVILDMLLRPGKVYRIFPTVTSRSALGCPPSWSCRENLQSEEPRKHPKLKFKPPYVRAPRPYLPAILRKKHILVTCLCNHILSVTTQSSRQGEDGP